MTLCINFNSPQLTPNEREFMKKINHLLTAILLFANLGFSQLSRGAEPGAIPMVKSRSIEAESRLFAQIYKKIDWSFINKLSAEKRQDYIIKQVVHATQAAGYKISEQRLRDTLATMPAAQLNELGMKMANKASLTQSAFLMEGVVTVALLCVGPQFLGCLVVAGLLGSAVIIAVLETTKG